MGSPDFRVNVEQNRKNGAGTMEWPKRKLLLMRNKNRDNTPNTVHGQAPMTRNKRKVTIYSLGGGTF